MHSLTLVHSFFLLMPISMAYLDVLWLKNVTSSVSFWDQRTLSRLHKNGKFIFAIHAKKKMFCPIWQIKVAFIFPGEYFKWAFSIASKLSSTTVLGRLICNFHFVTLRFYVTSNLSILGGIKLQFWSFWRS